MSLTHKYRPLVSYLNTLSAEQPSVRLRYADIEALLGCPLPIAAWLPHFWSGGRTARTNWRANGFSAALDRQAEAVVFTRQPPSSRPCSDRQSSQE